MNSLKPSTKQSLSNVAQITIFILLVVIMWGGMFLIVKNIPQEGKVYDCSLAEISPDYPVEVKIGCRKLRMIKE
jgi:TRAP-type C4-dicarboxylate transport system permease small subunit